MRQILQFINFFPHKHVSSGSSRKLLFFQPIWLTRPCPSRFCRKSFFKGTSTSRRTPETDAYVGKSGRKYKTKNVFQEEEFPRRWVSLANDEHGRPYIIKYIPEVNYSYLELDIYGRLRRSAKNVRLPVDMIPEKSMFVFPYFRDHLLRLAQNDLPLKTTKHILKESLLGIAAMHDKDIVHTDIKADNVLINWKQQKDGTSIEQVQIGDLEDAAHLPGNLAIIGRQAGNYMWRSPEATACRPIHKPSDIFSFALVRIYAVHKKVIFGVGDEELEGGKVERLAIVIERYISYFGELPSVNALIEKHLAPDNPYGHVFAIARDGFDNEHPRQPFKMWKGVDDDLKDLVAKMTDLDPSKRITAKEALQHEWFRV